MSTPAAAAMEATSDVPERCIPAIISGNIGSGIGAEE